MLVNCNKIVPGEISFCIILVIVTSMKTNKGNRRDVSSDTVKYTIHSRTPAERCAKVQKCEFGEISRISHGETTLYRIEIFRSEKACSFPFTIASPRRSYGAVFFRHLIQQLGYESPGNISFFLRQNLISPTL